MKHLNYLLVLLVLFSCTKQEFQTNKSSSSSAITGVSKSCSTLFTQSTLVKPKVDLLFLWDNTSSFNFVTEQTKRSMGNLISSVSENFDYHILNAPLVPSQTTSLFEMSLVASDPSSVSGNASSILKSKDEVTIGSALSFTSGVGGSEKGIDRAYNIITSNRTNGIFRDGAYTIIVMMSNEDDKGCELATGYNKCTSTDKNNYLAPLKQKMLCLRGNTSAYNCSGYPTLNSSMMRFITIAPVDLNNNSCAVNQNYPIASNYRTISELVYSSTYTNGWPTSNDHLNPDVPAFRDSYNLCSVSNFSSIFDGVNSAIKQTLIKHVYSYWPLASSTASVDPTTIQVTTSSGKTLTRHDCVATNSCTNAPTDGFGYVGNQSNHATRTFPNDGEYYTGKMIQLFGSNGNDLVIYPTSLTVCYQPIKDKYKYIYLTNGQPYEPSIEVTINGQVVPKSTTNGWSYMGLQYISALDNNFKIANLPANATSGYIVVLNDDDDNSNGNYQITNSSNVTIDVYYTSKSN